MGWQNVFASFLQAGNTVIINASGFFVYNGVPALGNLVASSAPSSGVDKFGNAYFYGDGVYGPNGTMNLSPNGGQFANPALLFHTTGTTPSLFPQVVAAFENGGLANEQVGIVVISGEEGSGDLATIQLFSESADATIAASLIINLGSVAAITGNKTRITHNTPVTMTSGTQTAQTTVLTDTWHRVTVFDNGWVASGAGTNGMAYRITTDQMLEIVFDMVNPAPGVNSQVITFTGVAIPAVPQNLDVEWNNPQANNSASQPWAFIDASGNFSFIGIQVVNKPIFGRVKAILPSF